MPSKTQPPVFRQSTLEPVGQPRFGEGVCRARHELHRDPLFRDAGLIALLDRYPREHIGVFTMGDTPDSWQRGRLGDISGARLLEAVKSGRIWLNLRGASDHDAEIAQIRDNLFRETKSRVRRFFPFRKDVGLLISSPRARVFYHLDIPRVMLLHLRGRKRFYVYPREVGFIEPADLENVARGITEEEIPYSDALDAGAAVFDLVPGDMVHWPQNAPHRIDNGNDLNVSLSVEFMTPMALLRANALYANGWLREKFGWSAGLEDRPSLAWFWKVPLAQLIRLSGRISAQTREAPLPPSFTLNSAGKPVF